MIIIRFLVLIVEGDEINLRREELTISLLEELADGLDRRGEAVTSWLERDEQGLIRSRVNFNCLCHFGVEDKAYLIRKEVKLQDELLA